MTTFHFKLVRRKTKENKVIVPKLATTTICVSVHLKQERGLCELVESQNGATVVLLSAIDEATL